jgi:hypothetical protein
MKLRKTILVSVLIGFAFTSINSQNKKFNFFGSYSYGIGNLTASISSDLRYPETDEVKKLTSGTISQIELGVYYHSFGLGLIHNAYATNASTTYDNGDANGDGYFENGILSDKLNLSFNGLELLYKTPVFSPKFDVTWKMGLGFQSYSINKDMIVMGTYASHYNYTLTGNILTTMFGAEINYLLSKIVSIGLETSILPGKYTKLKNAESTSFIYKDNVTRLSTGLKIKLTI